MKRLMNKISKYRSIPTLVNGITFHSKKEAEKYRDLLLLERAKKVSDLQMQVPFPCVVNGKKICSYFADFVYTEKGKQVVLDVKGYRTPLYKMKKKLVEALYDLKILEV